MARRVLAILALWLCPVGGARAQESNYWTNEYGTESTLLSGTVISGSADLGATFYNPASLVLAPSPQFAVSTKAYEYFRRNLNNAAGSRSTVSESAVGVVPSLFAVAVQLPFMGGRPLVFSGLDRSRVDLRLVLREGFLSDVLRRHEGAESVAVEALLEQDVTDNWFGISSATEILPGLAVGATAYVSARSYRRRTQLDVLVLDPDAAASALRVNEVQYSSYSILSIVGLTYVTKRYSMGLILMTPNLQLISSGQSWAALHHAGLDLDGDGLTDPEANAQAGRELGVTYRAPWSLGAGIRLVWDDSSLFLAVQYFSRVKPYTVLRGPQENEATSAELVDGADPVLNGGIGLERRFTESLSIIGSFVTDFSSRPDGFSNNHSLSNWDLFHVTAGVTLGERDEATLVLGVGFDWGNGPFVLRANLAEAEEQNRLFGNASETMASTWAVRAILGLSFASAEDDLGEKEQGGCGAEGLLD